MKAIIICVFFASAVSGYSAGAPSCLDAPGHGVDPQDGDHGFDIKKTIEDKIVTITISSPSNFKGLLVTTKSPGEFEVLDDHTQTISCPDKKGITHTNGKDKTDVTIRFVQEEGSKQEPTFKLILVKDFSTFWNDIVI